MKYSENKKLLKLYKEIFDIKESENQVYLENNKMSFDQLSIDIDHIKENISNYLHDEKFIKLPKLIFPSTIKD